MFNGAVPNQAGFDDARLDLAGKSWPNFGRLHDLVTMLFSFDGLDASFETIRGQRDPFVSYLASGERHPTEKWEEIRELGGHRAAFLRDADYDMHAADGWPLFSFSYSAGHRYKTTFGALHDLLRYCRERHIELHVTISPLHAHKLLEIRQVGLWDQYEIWKRSVVSAVEEANSVPSDKPVVLWDFSALHALATEPVPPLHDTRAQMRWYWEGSHYKRVVGDAMLDRVFGVSSVQLEIPDDFGVKLSSETLAASLASVRTELDRYAAEHADQVQALATLFMQTAHLRAEVLSKRGRHPLVQ
jgi:hypothetical protein